MSMPRLNAFGLQYSSHRCTAYRQELADPAGLKVLREQLGPDWFIHWRNGVAWGSAQNQVRGYVLL